MSTFRLKVSKTALRLNFDEITNEEKQILFAGVKFNPDTHDIFRFFVAPEFIISDKRSKRTRMRKDFSLADTITVEVKSPSPEISFIGILPVTTTIEKKNNFFLLPIIGHLKPAGNTKELVKQGKHSVLARRTDEFVFWFFLKPYIDSGQDFMMQTVCIVPKSLPPEQRFLVCDAAVMHKSRELQGARAKKILLPI